LTNANVYSPSDKSVLPRQLWRSAKASIVDPVFPTLTLLSLAAIAEQENHTVSLMDLSYNQYDYRDVSKRILDFSPDVVGLSSTTPLMNQVRDISCLVKSISPDILTVAGVPHATALPRESLLESNWTWSS